MELTRKLAVTVSAAAVALGLLAGPAIAVDESPPADDDGDHRIEMAETPRDRLGLLLLGALFAGGGLALYNGRRQLRGERDQATGEFRWR